jgi:hypothetical protein
MRTAVLAAALVALGWAFGRARADDDDNNAPASTAAKTTAISGCLSGTEGDYMLNSMAKAIQVSGLDDLKSHVTHEVKLTGTWSDEKIAETDDGKRNHHPRPQAPRTPEGLGDPARL